MNSTIMNTNIIKILTNKTKRYKYNMAIIKRFNNPNNKRTIIDKKENKNVYKSLISDPTSSDALKLEIMIDSDNIIQDVKLKKYGCETTIVSSEYTCELIRRKDIYECLEIKNKDIRINLSLSPVKIHCSMLSENIIKKVVYEYSNEREKKNNEKQ